MVFIRKSAGRSGATKVQLAERRDGRNVGLGSVVGLAPSAAAAEVLAQAVGIPAENTAKWLTEQQRQPGRLADLEKLRVRLDRASPSLTTRRLLATARALSAEINRWRLRPGQLVIVDEASLAGTLDLARLSAHAVEVGAKLVLVGDPHQLSAVPAGGAFRLLIADRAETTPEDPAPRLTRAGLREKRGTSREQG